MLFESIHALQEGPVLGLGVQQHGQQDVGARVHVAGTVAGGGGAVGGLQQFVVGSAQVAGKFAAERGEAGFEVGDFASRGGNALAHESSYVGPIGWGWRREGAETGKDGDEALHPVCGAKAGEKRHGYVGKACAAPIFIE